MQTHCNETSAVEDRTRLALKFTGTHLQQSGAVTGVLRPRPWLLATTLRRHRMGIAKLVNRAASVNIASTGSPRYGRWHLTRWRGKLCNDQLVWQFDDDTV